MCNECHLSIDSYSNLAFLDSEGRYHCRDGPAVIWPNNEMICYYRHGQRHREGGPAVIWSSGAAEYWANGKRHRDGNKPAVIYASRDVEYWENGKFVKKVKKCRERVVV